MKEIDFTVTAVPFAYYKECSSNYVFTVKNRTYNGLTLVLSGEVLLSSGEERIRFRKGDVILQRIGDSYTLSAVGDERASYIVISYLAVPRAVLEETLFSSRLFRPERLSGYREAFERAARLYASESIACKPLLCALVQEIICNVLRENYPRALKAMDNPAAVARYYLEEYCERQITSAELASLAGCSPSHLRFLFRTAYGDTPMRYLNRVRVEKAKRLLADHMLRLDEVAEKCGFRNVYYFSRVFKELTGVSPGQY